MICSEKPHIYTVAELNSLARQLLEGSLGQIWITGEISNLVQPSSGHWYFSLKDAQAQVRCALFRMTTLKLKFLPQNGQQVTVLAQVSLYENRGDFQLIIQQMEPSGDGILQKAFEVLKKRLEAAGLFARERKKPLPFLPKIIGVITSQHGAAIHDILTVLKRRFPAIPIIIYPTLVQGALAANQIVDAIQTANHRAECNVIILARGGGSLEDLWPFNEEIVAKAIYASTIPIITGIGHEVDFTIADLVADERAATPSVAAERVCPDFREWQQRLSQEQKRLTHLITTQLSQYKTHLLHIKKRLRHPGQRLQEQAQRLDHLEYQLLMLQKHFFAHCKNQFYQLLTRWQHIHPGQRFTQDHEFLRISQQRLITAIRHSLSQKQQQLQQAVHILQAFNPLEILERGYAVVRQTSTQKIISRANQLQIDDEILVTLAEGFCLAVVSHTAD